MRDEEGGEKWRMTIYKEKGKESDYVQMSQKRMIWKRW